MQRVYAVRESCFCLLAFFLLGPASDSGAAGAAPPEIVRGTITLINHGDKRFILDGNREFQIADAAVGSEMVQLDWLVIVTYDPTKGAVTRVSIPGRGSDPGRMRSQGPSSRPPDAARSPEPVRTFVDATGKYRVEAEFLECKDGAVRLKKRDGSIARVPIAKLSEADQKYVSGLTEVQVTGVGTSRDKAEQHAYASAIEKAVGVLVDAETLVENDEIIREKVLTFSRGYVAKFEVVGTREDGGLHYVKARAWVAVSELGEKLAAIGVSVRPLPGKDERRRILAELQFEENAGEMFRNALRRCEYGLDKVIKVEVVGKH